MQYYTEIFLNDGTTKTFGTMHDKVSAAKNEAGKYICKNGLQKPNNFLTGYSQIIGPDVVDPVKFTTIYKIYKGGKRGVLGHYRWVAFNYLSGRALGGYFRKISK